MGDLSDKISVERSGHNWKSFIPLLIIFFVLGVMTYLVIKKQRETIKEQDKTISAITGVVISKVNKDSSKTSTVVAFQTDPKEFLRLKGAEAEVVSLQMLVRKYERQLAKGGAAVTFSDSTRIAVAAISTVRERDTIKGKDNIVYVYPEYSSSFQLGKWASGTTISNKDTTKVNLLNHDEYELAIGTERTGFLGLGAGKPFGEITSKSPYTDVPRVKVYSTTRIKQKRFSLSVHAGREFVVVGKDIKQGWGAGVGLSYALVPLF